MTRARSHEDRSVVVGSEKRVIGLFQSTASFRHDQMLLEKTW